MYKIVIALAAVAMLTGCASSTKIDQPVASTEASAPVTYSDIVVDNRGTEAPEHFLVAVKSYLRQELDRQAMYSPQSGKQVVITVVDYRMRSGFSRAMFGVLAGKDGIDSQVTIKDSKSGKVIGRSTVSSYNVLAVGGMEDIARMHAEEIAKFLGAKKS